MAKVARRESLEWVERQDREDLVLTYLVGASTSSMYKPNCYSESSPVFRISIRYTGY